MTFHEATQLRADLQQWHTDWHINIIPGPEYTLEVLWRGRMGIVNERSESALRRLVQTFTTEVPMG